MFGIGIRREKAARAACRGADRQMAIGAVKNRDDIRDNGRRRRRYGGVRRSPFRATGVTAIDRITDMRE